MSRDNGKKYPRTIESKNSYLRIRAPEHLEVALEGLIRKVLKEQPKMDDIYAFAADYFDMLLKIREKAGIRKLSDQDICPLHNEEDASDMIKLVSNFTKRKRELKPTSRTYRAVSLKYSDDRQERKEIQSTHGDVKNGERFKTVLPIVNEHPEMEDLKPTAADSGNEKSESDPEKNDLNLEIQRKPQEPIEKIVEAKEVILDEDIDEDGTPVETNIEAVGDIMELRDKIKEVENEIQLLEKKESENIENENSVGDIVDEDKLEACDTKSAEAIPIIEEPEVETDGAKPSIESKVTIEEVSDEKEIDQDKANTVNAERAGTDLKTDNIIAEVQEINDETVQEREGELKAGVVTQYMDDAKVNDEILNEETVESKADSELDSPVLNNELGKTKEEKPSDEMAAETTEEEKANGKTDIEGAEERPSNGTLDEATQEEKTNDDTAIEETQGDKTRDETEREETEEEKSNEKDDVEATQGEKPDLDTPVDKEEEEKPNVEISTEKMEEKKLNDERVIEETQGDKTRDETEIGATEEEKPNEKDVVEATQGEKPDLDTSVDKVEEEKPRKPEPRRETSGESGVGETEEEKLNGKDAVEASQEGKPYEEISIEKTVEENQGTEIKPTEEAEPTEEILKESQQTPLSSKGKTEESERTPEDESGSDEIPVTDGKAEEESKETVERITKNDETEEANRNEENTVPEMRSTDTAQAKEAELMEVEEPNNDKSDTEEFLNLEKKTEVLHNSEVGDRAIELGFTNETAACDLEKKTDDDDTAVIIAAEDVEKNAAEDDGTAPIAESNDAEDTEGSSSVPLGAILVAGGMGAAAAVLDNGRRELAASKTEENTENEEKVAAEPQLPAKDFSLIVEAHKAETTLAKEVEKFLDYERQHSSNDKEREEINVEQREEDTDATDVEIVSKIIPDSLARMTISQKIIEEQTNEQEQPEPSDVDTGDGQERDGSTTSDEMEFEVSPLKNSEIPINLDNRPVQTGTPEENHEVNIPASEENDPEKENVERGKTHDEPEPKIVLEVNASESQDQTTGDTVGDEATEQVKVYLEVPEAAVVEYPGRKTEDGRSESSGDAPPPEYETVNAEGEEAITDCANVGNELIQTGEVQKVELIEGDEDILQVHLTTTIETVQEDGDSLLVQMTSKVEPIFEVSMETRVESPVAEEKMRMVKAAVIIQNGFRRFRKRKVTGEPLDISTNDFDTSTVSETKPEVSSRTVLTDASSRESVSSFSSSATKISKGQILSRSATRTLLDTHSLGSIRKITPLKTRSLSTVRYGVADFEVWNQLVKELEEAATKIQSKYRGYKTRKKLQRGNAIQSTTTTSEETSITADSAEVTHRHTGEFHDSIVLPVPPK